MTAAAAPLGVADAVAIRRVVMHVLEAQVAGTLPRLRWHLGLTASERHAMHARWPIACTLWEELDGLAAQDSPELLTPLRDLLMAERASSDPAMTVLANAFASAAFGAHHLWQDLGAKGRDEVSRLIELGFPTLHASNLRNLRWKRHLFLVLGDRLGRSDLRPPKCDGCDDYDVCFGSAAPLTIRVIDTRQPSKAPP